MKPILTAVLLCPAPASAEPGRITWIATRGGPLHIIHSAIFVRAVPCTIGLAIFVRMHGLGRVELRVRIAGPTGPVALGGSLARGLQKQFSLRNTGGMGEAVDLARIALIPEMPIDRTGAYTVLVDLISGDAEVSSLPAAFTIHTGGAVSSVPASAGVRASALERELAPRMASDSVRALRLATYEAHRLGHMWCGAEHLLIALRRVIGRHAGLPRAEYLRAAIEEREGLVMSDHRRSDTIWDPAVVEHLRVRASGSGSSVTAADLLTLVLAPGTAAVVTRAQLLSTQIPR